MKTFLKHGTLQFLAILMLILPRCTDVLDEMGLGHVNSYQPPEKKRVQINGIILADHVGIFIGSRTESELKESFIFGHGNLDSNGLLKISSRHTHFTYRISDKEFQVKEGQFEYLFEDGDILFGTYNGYGSLIEGDPYFTLNLNISGGIGNYKNAAGNIEAIISPDPESKSSGLKVNVSGVILVLEKNNP